MQLVLEDVACALLCLSSQAAQWRHMKRGMSSLFPFFTMGRVSRCCLLVENLGTLEDSCSLSQEATLTRFSVNTGPSLGQDT